MLSAPRDRKTVATAKFIISRGYTYPEIPEFLKPVFKQ
jgi:hypothetical protein